MIQNQISQLHQKALGTSLQKSAIKSVSFLQKKSSGLAELNSLEFRPGHDDKKSSAKSPSSSDTSSVTNAWLKTGASKEIAAMYFPDDYSQTPTKVGGYTLDPSQSRIRSAINLGKAPFANSSNDIADYFGFSTASSSGAPEPDLYEKKELEEEKETKDGIGEEIIREFEKAERQELKDKLDKIRPQDLKDNNKFNPKLDPNKVEPKEIKQEQKKITKEQETKPEAQHHKEEAPLPPPKKEEEEKKNISS